MGRKSLIFLFFLQKDAVRADFRYLFSIPSFTCSGFYSLDEEFQGSVTFFIYLINARQLA